MKGHHPDVNSSNQYNMSVWSPGRRQLRLCDCSQEDRQDFWSDVRRLRLVVGLAVVTVLLRLIVLHMMQSTYSTSTIAPSYQLESHSDSWLNDGVVSDGDGFSDADFADQSIEALINCRKVTGKRCQSSADTAQSAGSHKVLSGVDAEFDETNVNILSSREQPRLASAWEAEWYRPQNDVQSEQRVLEGARRTALDKKQTPGDPDSKQKDDDDFNVRMMLWITLPVSICMCLALMANYVSDRQRRRHPASLVLGRSVYDAVCCVALLTSMVVLDKDAKKEQDIAKAGFEEDLCRPFSFFVEFAALGAELYVLMLSLDFMIAVSNPFTNFRSNRGRYHMGVFVVSAAISLVMVVVEGGYRAGAPAFWGEDKVLGICWIRRDRDSSDPSNVLTFFVAPMCLVFVVATYAIVFANQRLGQGLPATLQTRLAVFRTHSAFVGSYVAYWIIFAAAYIASLTYNKSDKRGDKQPLVGISMLLGVAVGSRGIVTGLVWFATRDLLQWCCRSRASAGGSSGGGSSRRSAGRANDLNVALRKEILFYTTFGIRKSVKYAGRFPKCDRTGGVNPNGLVTIASGNNVGIHYNRILLTREWEAGSWTRQRRGEGEHGGGRSSGRARGVQSSDKIEKSSTPLLQGHRGGAEAGAQQPEGFRREKSAIQGHGGHSHSQSHDHRQLGQAQGIAALERRGGGAAAAGRKPGLENLQGYVPPTAPVAAAVRLPAPRTAGAGAGAGARTQVRETLREAHSRRAATNRKDGVLQGEGNDTGGARALKLWSERVPARVREVADGNDSRRSTTISLPRMQSSKHEHHGARVRGINQNYHHDHGDARDDLNVRPVSTRGTTLGFPAERKPRVGVPRGLTRTYTEVPAQREIGEGDDRRPSAASSESDFVAGLGNEEEMKQKLEREEKAAMAGAADIPLALVNATGVRGASSQGRAPPDGGMRGALNAALGLGMGERTAVPNLGNTNGDAESDARSDIEVTTSSSSSSGSSSGSESSESESRSGSGGPIGVALGEEGSEQKAQGSGSVTGDGGPDGGLEHGMMLLRGPSDGADQLDLLDADGSEAGSRLASIGASESGKSGSGSDRDEDSMGGHALPATSFATMSTAAGGAGAGQRGPPATVAAAMSIPSTLPLRRAPADADADAGVLEEDLAGTRTSSSKGRGSQQRSSLPVQSLHSLNAGPLDNSVNIEYDQGTSKLQSSLRIGLHTPDNGSGLSEGREFGTLPETPTPTEGLAADEGPGNLTMEDAWDTSHGVAKLHPPIAAGLNPAAIKELREGLLGQGEGGRTGVASRLALLHRQNRTEDGRRRTRGGGSGQGSSLADGSGVNKSDSPHGEGTTTSRSTRHRSHGHGQHGQRKHGHSHHGHSQHGHHEHRGRHHHTTHGGQHDRSFVHDKYSCMYGGFGPGHFIGGFGGEQTHNDLVLFAGQWDRIRKWMALEERWRHSERKRQHRLRRLRHAPLEDREAQARLKELVAPHPVPIPGKAPDSAAPFEHTTLPAMSKGAGSFWESCLEDTCFGEMLPYLTCGNPLGCDNEQAFVFRDYEPHIFRKIREQDGIDQGAYENALGETRREKFSEGASGAFLYFSGDERFIVKTMQKEECDQLLAMLADYQEHIHDFPDSLLTRFYGCHSLRMYGHVMYFVVMGNVFITQGKTIHERFDLKGSWVNRHRQPVEKGKQMECRYCNQKFTVGDKREDGMCSARPNRNHEPNNVSKDNDLNFKLRLDRSTSRQVGDTIIADTNFLRDHGIMDYSLLLGIHRETYHLMQDRKEDDDDTGGPGSAGAASSEVSGKRGGSGTGRSGLSSHGAGGDGRPPRITRSQTASQVHRGVIAVSTESRLGQWATEEAQAELIGEEGMPELGTVGQSASYGGHRSATFAAGDRRQQAGGGVGSLPDRGGAGGHGHGAMGGGGVSFGSLRSNGSSLRGGSHAHRPSPLRSAIRPAGGQTDGRHGHTHGHESKQLREQRTRAARLGLSIRKPGPDRDNSNIQGRDRQNEIVDAGNDTGRRKSGAFHGSKVVGREGASRGVLRRLDTPKMGGHHLAADSRDEDLTKRLRREGTPIAGQEAWGLGVGSPQGRHGRAGSAWGLLRPDSSYSEAQHWPTGKEQDRPGIGSAPGEGGDDLERLRKGKGRRGQGRGEPDSVGLQREQVNNMHNDLGLAVGGFARGIREGLQMEHREATALQSGSGQQQQQQSALAHALSSPNRGGIQDEETLGMLAGAAVWSDDHGMPVVNNDAVARPADGDVMSGDLAGNTGVAAEAEEAEEEDPGAVLHSASHKKQKMKMKSSRTEDPKHRATKSMITAQKGSKGPLVGLKQVSSHGFLSELGGGAAGASVPAVPVAAVPLLPPPRYMRVRSVLGRENMFSGRGSDAGVGGVGSVTEMPMDAGSKQMLRRRRSAQVPRVDGAGASSEHRAGGSEAGRARRANDAGAAEEGRVGTPAGQTSQFKSFFGGLRAAMVESPGIYYMGVIDILQAFTLEKRIERFVKTYLLCKDPQGISAIEPRQYASRFRRRVVYQTLDHFVPTELQRERDRHDELLDMEEEEHLGCMGGWMRCEGEDGDDEEGEERQGTAAHQRVLSLRGRVRAGSGLGPAWGVPGAGASGAAGVPRRQSVDHSPKESQGHSGKGPVGGDLRRPLLQG